MRKIRNFIECFVSVTTGILVIAAITYRFQPEALTPDTLWQILLSAALCALATALFFPSENASKLRIWVGVALHFISLCVIMILCARRFGWIDSTIPQAATMVGYVVVVYAFTTGISYIIEKKEVSQMNQLLQENYPDNNGEK